MSTPAKVTVNLETRTEGWAKGLDYSQKETVKWVKGIEKEFKALTFGGGKGFGGNGAAFAGELAGVAKEAREVATELRTGGNQAEILSNYVSKIPIVGQFHQAGMAIRELIFGTQAAKIETQKQVESVKELTLAYDKLRRANAIRGLYGDERALQQVDNDKDQRLADIANRRNDLKTDVMRLAEVQSNTFHWVTDAERFENERKKRQIVELNQETIGATKDAEQAKFNITREANDRQHEYLKSTAQEVDELEATMMEKSLRRQGKGVESAIVAIEAKRKREVEDLQDSIRDEALKGMSAEHAQERRESVARKIIAVNQFAEDAVADLRDVQFKKEQEQTIGNLDKLKEIEASGNIERLKLQDENLNAMNEKRGVAARSHLADAAEIEEAYRKQRGELFKKQREDGTDYRDPTFQASLSAAKLERDQKLGLLGAKGENETLKNQEASLKEQRRLWESVGEPMDKYLAKIADINEHFEKFHDATLRAQELKNLDKDTLSELKNLNPDHETPIQLYGRTGSFADVKVGGAGAAIAQQQLAEMKKQAAHADAWQIYFRDIWDWVRKQSGGIIPEFKI